MQHFDKKIYKLLEKMGVHKCPKKEASYIRDSMPSFIEELLLNFEWPKDYYFKIRKTKSFWFTGEDDDDPIPYEFLGENTQKCEQYFILASNQGLDICLDPYEKNVNDPTCYLVNEEELQYQKNKGYDYIPDTFKLSWFLKRVKEYKYDKE